MKKTVITLNLALAVSLGFSQNWTETQKQSALDRGQTDYFGYAVDIDGNYAVVGSYLEDEDATGTNTVSGAGSVYIYERNGAGIWNQIQKIVSSDRALNDNFGYDVAIDGDFIAVGARWEDHDASGSNNQFNAGSVYIFKKNTSGIWVQEQKIVASDRSNSDEFGTSVAISGSFIVVGAPEEDDDEFGGNALSKAGSAYVFERNGAGVWNQVNKIVAADRNIFDSFGASVAISGSYLVVGAPEEDEDVSGLNTLDNSGAAYIFSYDGNNWLQQNKIVSSDRQDFDQFGKSVDIDGDVALIGAPFEDHDTTGIIFKSNAGSAYFFERNGSSWPQMQKVAPNDRSNDDNFGWDVSLDNNLALFGANVDDDDENNASPLADAGSAYLYQRFGNNWSESQKFDASDRAMDDLFGSAVSISGGYAIIGAFWEDEDAAGLNNLDGSGSVYFFEDQITTDVSSEITSNDFKLYPNPTTGLAQLKVEASAQYDVIIRDVSGRVVSHETNLSGINYAIDLTSQPSGLYIVQVGSNGNMNQIRVLKQ